MKRTPLTRRTPLARTTTGLVRTPLAPRTTRVNPMSDRRRRRDAGYQNAREECHRRAAGACMAVAADGCTGRAEQCHHIGGRGGDDPHRQGNLLATCAPCHRWIHANPHDAYTAGLMTYRTP